jgi:hypothetical protein
MRTSLTRQIREALRACYMVLQMPKDSRYLSGAVPSLRWLLPLPTRDERGREPRTLSTISGHSEGIGVIRPANKGATATMEARSPREGESGSGSEDTGETPTVRTYYRSYPILSDDSGRTNQSKVSRFSHYPARARYGETLHARGVLALARGGC